MPRLSRLSEIVPERVQHGAEQLRSLGRAIMEEPTWGERIALGACVARGLGRAAVHDLVLNPIAIARFDRAAPAAAAMQSAEIVLMPERQAQEPVFAEAA